MTTILILYFIGVVGAYFLLGFLNDKNKDADKKPIWYILTSYGFIFAFLFIVILALIIVTIEYLENKLSLFKYKYPSLKPFKNLFKKKN